MPGPGLPNPTNNALVAVAEAANTASAVTTPVLAGYNNSRFQSRLCINLNRDANVGGGAVKGAFLPAFGPIPEGRDPDNTSQGRLINGTEDGIAAATGRSYFYADIPFVALSGNNWVCMFCDASAGTLTPLTPAASATTSAGEFFIETYDSGAQVKLTVGASAAGGAVADNDQIRLFYVDSDDVRTLATYTNGALAPSLQESNGCDIAWLEADATSTPSALNVYLKPLVM